LTDRFFEFFVLCCFVFCCFVVFAVGRAWGDGLVVDLDMSFSLFGRGGGSRSRSEARCGGV